MMNVLFGMSPMVPTAVTLQAVKVRAAEKAALEAGDYLVAGLAKAERQELMRDDDFCRFDYVQTCKAEGVDWGCCF